MVENFSDQTTHIPVKDLFEVSAEAWKGKTRKHGWLNTQSMEAYLLNDEKTDTMVIQNFDLGTHYANIVKQCTNVEYDAWTPDEKWTKKISDSMLTLIQAADELERGEAHKVQQLVTGAVDIAKFIGAHIGDFLEVTLKIDTERLHRCAIPTEVTTLVLSGFGLIKGIEFANLLIGGQTTLIEQAFWHAPRESNPEHGKRTLSLDERKIRFDCVTQYDYQSECGIDDDASTDEDTSIDGEDTSEDEGLGTHGDADGEESQ